jgi:hypothetical protein
MYKTLKFKLCLFLILSNIFCKAGDQNNNYEIKRNRFTQLG